MEAQIDNQEVLRPHGLQGPRDPHDRPSVTRHQVDHGEVTG